MSATTSDSHGALDVPKNVHLSKIRFSYRKLVSRWHLNLSVPRSISPSTALVSAALTTAAPVFKFGTRRLLFVPEVPTFTRQISVSQLSFYTASEGDDVPPSTLRSSSVGVPQRPCIRVRTISADGSFARSSLGPNDFTWMNNRREVPTAATFAQPVSSTSHWLEIPPSPHHPGNGNSDRQNRFKRRPSLFRNASQDSHASRASTRSVSSQVSVDIMDKFRRLLSTMDDLIDSHKKKLRSPLLNIGHTKTLKSECREALVSFQKEIHSLDQKQVTDTTDPHHSSSLFKLYHELREMLLNHKCGLSKDNLSDPNYCKNFCGKIEDCRVRLASFKHGI
ncbi:hypothetical protein TrVFT333_003380 [Trichoderma virens FT-333]|nr:hypothetical protein TrVFT333_003380 [Trichoderma virens FT-333]